MESSNCDVCYQLKGVKNKNTFIYSKVSFNRDQREYEKQKKTKKIFQFSLICLLMFSEIYECDSGEHDDYRFSSIE